VVNGAFTNVAIQGDGASRDEVVLVGAGMTHANYGLVPYAIATGGGVDGVTIANLTIRDVYRTRSPSIPARRIRTSTTST